MLAVVLVIFVDPWPCTGEIKVNGAETEQEAEQIARALFPYADEIHFLRFETGWN